MNDQFAVHVPVDHPAFAGHFPGEPIVPGVVLLDEALYRIGKALRVATHDGEVQSVKFLSAARPGETLQLDITRDATERVAFAIRAPDRLIASGVLTLPARARDESWATHRERGSMFWLRVMSWISLRLGRGVSRVITYCIAAYFFMFAPRARRHARDYLRRVLGRSATPMDRFRQILTFASTIHDRVFFLNGRFELFDVSVDGEATVCAMRNSNGGALLMGAHLGSFEATRALGRRLPGQQITMAMYADNARKINAALTAISPRLKADIIELGPLTALLEIRARLAAGSFVGMMGDRALGAEPVERVMFLGAPAAFPLGPFRVAAKLRRPVCFMAGLYLGGNRYHVVFEPIADFSTIGSDDEAVAVREALHRYVAVVERHCRKYPYNWFNFLDFWGVQS